MLHVHKPVLERSVVIFEISEALSDTQLWRGVGVRGGGVRRGGGGPTVVEVIPLLAVSWSSRSTLPCRSRYTPP